MVKRRKDGPRPAVIATCQLRQGRTANADEFLRERLAMIDQMARRAEERGWRLDLAVLPECTSSYAKKSVEEVAEALDGKTVRAIAEKARQHGIYATAPLHLLQEGRVYNSVALLGRQGETVGVYSKVFPVMMTDGSLEHGVTPGREFPVFELDFGRVGIQICWDMWFDPGWQALGDQDVELVVFPTNPASPLVLRGRAWRHEYYIVASTTDPPAMVADPTGRVLGETSEDGEVLVVRVDLDYRVLHSNCLWEWPDSKRKEYAGRISLEWDRESHEYLVTSSDPSLPVRRFLEQEGLLTGRQRVRRNQELLMKGRGGAPVMPSPVERD